MSADSTAIGALLPFEERYELRRQLWLDGPHGGYSAFDHVLNREVIVNVAYRPHDSAAVIDRARILALLRHPNIVPILDLGVTDKGLPFFTIPKIQADPLDVFLRRLEENGAASTEPIPLKALVGVVCAVGRAVDHARELGIVNEDLWPDNILVGSGFHEVFVKDGWLRMRNPEADDQLGLSFPGVPCGRPAYMSREQCTGIAIQGPPSDVFSLGGVLHYILYGTPPNHLPIGSGAIKLLVAIMDGTFEPRKPGKLRPGISAQGFRGRGKLRELERICLKALDGDPGRRHPEVRTLLGDLERWIDRR